MTPGRFHRPPSEVMRLARMGAAHPTRLSFLRQLLRRVEVERWGFDRPVWRLDDRGVGVAVYRLTGPRRVYSLVAFSHDLPPEQRSDRVIAEAWDATFALHDGTPDESTLARLQANVPLQEAGRVTGSELCLSRANRSVRVFERVVDRLARGRQPEAAELDAVGYLMRTTAVYGSGKFGAADHCLIADRAELEAPFQAEMMTVWLIRSFMLDLVDHLASVRGGANATRLAPALRRRLGVGNSTGLGMAPFLVRHPILLNNWMLAREEALARVRALPAVTGSALADFQAALTRAQANAAVWRSEHPRQAGRLQDLRQDLERLDHYLRGWPGQRQRSEPHPWDALWRWGGTALSLEGQEALLALLLEPHGDRVDGLGGCMSADESGWRAIDGRMSVGELRSLLQRHYAWALEIDYSEPGEQALFWYVSEEKLEPRLGARGIEPGAELEQPLDIGRQARKLADALAGWQASEPLAAFLLACPEHRSPVRRIQTTRSSPYAEIQDNLIGSSLCPIDLLRCKLAFFGASRFDPRSDRWVRISLFQDAPGPEELCRSTPARDPGPQPAASGA